LHCSCQALRHGEEKRRSFGWQLFLPANGRVSATRGRCRGRDFARRGRRVVSVVYWQLTHLLPVDADARGLGVASGACAQIRMPFVQRWGPMSTAGPNQVLCDIQLRRRRYGRSQPLALDAFASQQTRSPVFNQRKKHSNVKHQFPSNFADGCMCFANRLLRE
jgi:hypothetical protein